jgi:hypothetical protein
VLSALANIGLGIAVVVLITAGRDNETGGALLADPADP